jgi:hypothetical protein
MNFYKLITKGAKLIRNLILVLVFIFVAYSVWGMADSRKYENVTYTHPEFGERESDYYIRNEEVYYLPNNPGSISLSTWFKGYVLDGSDFDTFTAGQAFAADHDSVFFEHYEIPEADPLTFTLTWRESDSGVLFAQDKNAIYYSRWHGALAFANVTRIPELTSDQLESIGNVYLKDAQTVVIKQGELPGYKVVIGADVASFEIAIDGERFRKNFRDNIAKDKNGFYVNGDLVEAI